MTQPDKGEYLDVDGIRTFYVKEGSGHPLLLIHGAAPGACSLVTWKPNIEYFASSGFTVYAFDQPGYGYTDNPSDYSLEYRAAHAKSFIDKLGLDRFHMISQSRGTYIAMKLALEDRRTGRLVSTASGTVAPKGSAESGALSKKHEAELREYTPSLENIRAITMKTLFHQELVTDELVEARYEMSTGKNYEANLKRRETPPPKPITEELRNLKVKTLLVWGKNDQGVTLERALLLFQMIPDAELHVFDKSGHWPQWDQTSRFHKVVCDFLKD